LCISQQMKYLLAFIIIFISFGICLADPTVINFFFGDQNLPDDNCKAKIYYQQIVALYNHAIWPLSRDTTNALEAGNPPAAILDIFETNVSGRITGFGEFCGLESVAEYFFALQGPFGFPGEPPRPTNTGPFSLPQFLVYGNVAATRFITTASFPPELGGGTSQFVQTGFFTFSENDKIISYDVQNPNWITFSQPLISQFTNATVICAVAPGLCPNEYTGFEDCISFLDSIPVGNMALLNSNSVVCRYLHLLLALVNPAVHCPHVGKTGGGKCIDFSNEEYIQKLFAYTPIINETHCK